MQMGCRNLLDEVLRQPILLDAYPKRYLLASSAVREYSSINF